MAKIENKKNLSAFLPALLSSIKPLIAYSFSCSHQYSEQEIIGYFKNLIRARANDFIKAHGQKQLLKREGKIIDVYLKKIPKLVKIYKERMQQKREELRIDKEGEGYERTSS